MKFKELNKILIMVTCTEFSIWMLTFLKANARRIKLKCRLESTTCYLSEASTQFMKALVKT